MSKNKKGFFNKAIGVDIIKGGFSFTTALISNLKPKKNDYREETFEEALERLGIKEEEKFDHLIKIYNQLRIRFMIFFSAQIFLLIWGIYNISVANNYLTFVSTVVIFALLFVFNLSNSLRCYQIRVFKLGNIKEWMKNYKEWFPKKINKDFWSK